MWEGRGWEVGGGRNGTEEEKEGRPRSSPGRDAMHSLGQQSHKDQTLLLCHRRVPVRSRGEGFVDEP